MTLLIVKCMCLLLIADFVLTNGNGNESESCIECLCHAVSGCWNRTNCARYSINFNYWKTAGSPRVDPGDSENDEESFKNCMVSEACITSTIMVYTNRFGAIDCNCDDKFDCKDMLAIHLMGENCGNPKYGEIAARRFNDCSAAIGVSVMLPEEGSETCSLEDF